MFRWAARHALEERWAVTTVRPPHAVTSEFSTSICRFVLECSCGVTFDTNYIDEALEWREMHQSLAPLSDQLSTAART
jgi:hypothetical protein